MPNKDKTTYAFTDDKAPDDTAQKMYAMLTEENKKKVNRFVESLKAEQYTLLP